MAPDNNNRRDSSEDLKDETDRTPAQDIDFLVPQRPCFLKSNFYLSLDDIERGTRRDAGSTNGANRHANNSTNDKDAQSGPDHVNFTSGSHQHPDKEPLITPTRRTYTTPPSPLNLALRRGNNILLAGNLKNVSQKLLDAAFGANIRSPVLAHSLVESSANSLYTAPTKLVFNEPDHDYFNIGNYGSTGHHTNNNNYISSDAVLLSNRIEASHPSERSSINAGVPYLKDGNNRTALSQILTTDDFPMVAPEISSHFVQSETNSIYGSTKEQEAPIKRDFYNDFTSTDWVYDYQNLSSAKFHLRKLQGLRGKITRNFEAVSDWILLALVAFAFAIIAYIIDRSELLLFDLRNGYCSTNWLLNENACCSYNNNKNRLPGASKELFCEKWTTWASTVDGSDNQKIVDFSIYVASGSFLAFVSVLITLTTKSQNPLVMDKVASSNESNDGSQLDETPIVQSHPASRVIYSASGSGVPEVKTILSGFVIRKFLGWYAIVAKSSGLIFSVSSGLTLGKEGPFVHLATCVGNLCCRVFKKYNENELVKRQILSAAAGAGFALSLGSPLGGVLFSLEEITYYFTGSQLFKIFFCAMCSILFVQVLDPYGTGKAVLFETSYTSEWKPFELTYFVIIGIAGGLHGALFCKFAAIWWPKWFRKRSFIKGKFIKEVVLIAFLTAIVTYFNTFTKQPIPELLSMLAQPCDYSEASGKSNALCPQNFDEFPSVIFNLIIAFLIKLVFTAVSYGIKVPAGIYVPSMVLGAIFGRVFAMSVQYLQVHYPEFFISPDSCSLSSGDATCIDFGIYAMIGAGAFMAGITRMNVTLATTLFEITASYTYVLPVSIAIAVANWVANSIEPNSLYELLIINHNFPFLKNTRNIGFDDHLTIYDLLSEGCVNTENSISLNESDGQAATMSALRSQLTDLQRKGMIDGCLPVLQQDLLVGILPGPNLEFALDRLREFCLSYSIRNEVICKLLPHCTDSVIGDGDISSEIFASITSSRQQLGVEVLNELTDFIKILDTSPLQLDISAKVSHAELIFKRVGNRSICILEKGKFVGILHKKEFITYCHKAKYH